MTSISPIIPNLDLEERIFAAKDQPLPAHIVDGNLVLTRWRPSWNERLQILFGGSVWLGQLTFGHRLQPIKVMGKRIDAIKLLRKYQS